MQRILKTSVALVLLLICSTADAVCPTQFIGSWGGRYHYYCFNNDTCATNSNPPFVSASDTRSHTTGCAGGNCIDKISVPFLLNSASINRIDVNTNTPNPFAKRRTKDQKAGIAVKPDAKNSAADNAENFVTGNANDEVVFDGIVKAGRDQYRVIVVAMKRNDTFEYFYVGRETNEAADPLKGRGVLTGTASGTGQPIQVTVKLADMKNVDTTSANVGENTLAAHAKLPAEIVFVCFPKK